MKKFARAERNRGIPKGKDTNDMTAAIKQRQTADSRDDGMRMKGGRRFPEKGVGRGRQDGVSRCTGKSAKVR